MKNIGSEMGFAWPDRGSQLERIRRVIEQELTPIQQQTILAYYFQDMSIEDIAKIRGIHKSSAYRTLRRAEARVRRVMQYYID